MKLTNQERIQFLRDEIAAHEGGTNVLLSWDDATFEYTITVGINKKRCLASSKFFEDCIDKAAQI